jgi:hypothetical protein
MPKGPRPFVFDECYIPEPNSGCWLWEKSLDVYGYGRLGHDGLAHRHSWTIHRGPIPLGMHVLHKCDTPICVNPDHLFLGTAGDNARDRDKKGRGAKRSGEKSNLSKLTEADVLAIRSDTRLQVIISKIYGINQTTVSKIKCRKSWAHLA